MGGGSGLILSTFLYPYMEEFFCLMIYIIIIINKERQKILSVKGRLNEDIFGYVMFVGEKKNLKCGVGGVLSGGGGLS